MIAGPNGAGKTTTAQELFASTSILYEFLNADEIAKGLAPKNPETMALSASKLMISRLRELLEAKKNFAFETTLAGKNYAKYLETAKANGYEVLLVFLWLPNSQQAVKRVAQRVSQGGHNIPKDVIVRRYASGLKNLFNTYLPLADVAVVVNNACSERKNTDLIACKTASRVLEVLDDEIWNQMREYHD